MNCLPCREAVEENLSILVAVKIRLTYEEFGSSLAAAQRDHHQVEAMGHRNLMVRSRVLVFVIAARQHRVL